MANRPTWNDGWNEGVLSALKIVAANDGDISHAYRDIVNQCGHADLLAYAKSTDDSQVESIEKIVLEPVSQR